MIKPPHGLPDGMSASRPASGIKYYVVAASQRAFVDWVKRKGLKLQDCNYIGVIAGMQELGFSDPSVELVMLPGWDDGKGEEFYNEGCRLRSRYCLEKHKHDCPHE